MTCRLYYDLSVWQFNRIWQKPNWQKFFKRLRFFKKKKEEKKWKERKLNVPFVIIFFGYINQLYTFRIQPICDQMLCLLTLDWWPWWDIGNNIALFSSNLSKDCHIDRSRNISLHMCTIASSHCYVGEWTINSKWFKVMRAPTNGRRTRVLKTISYFIS